MKKKILSILLVLCISLVPTLLVACEGGEEQGGGGGGTTDIGSLPAADVDVTVEHVPSISYDTSDDPVTDASIKTDTLLVSYDIDETLTLYLDKETNVTVSDGETYTANGKRYNEYTVTATGAGDYNLYFVTADEELAASYTYTVSEAYPARTRFPAMTGLGQSNNSSTGIANAHDPSIIEVTEDGQSVYYTFGTDNYSQYGYAIRRSTDLINWSYVGVAIPGFNESGAAPSDSNPITESNELYDIYEIVSSDANWAANTADSLDENNWTLWAPNVVEAYGGGYWLYGCWTVNFGQGHSIIFQCYSESITGPYELVYTENNNPAIILYSYDGWEAGANALDPFIYYDTDGKMYMAYGSFSNFGIYAVELDPQTGLRKDGLEGDDLLSGSTVSAAQRYGTQLVSNATEGPTISYHEDVALYSGDPTAYDKSNVTYEDRYYLMTSSGSLSDEIGQEGYNMRSYSSTTATGTYAAKNGGSIRLINATGFVKQPNPILSRKDIDALGEFVKTYKAKGLATINVKEDAVQSSIAKFLTEDEMKKILSRAKAQPGDLLLIVADKNETVFAALGALRLYLAEKAHLIDESKYDILWITEFPQFEYSEEEGRFVAMHHPFTMPKEEDLPLIDTNPAAVRAKAYDLVINGQETGGGSIRIHSKEVQNKMFEALGFTEERIQKMFGWFVTALNYGTPPHGGLAFGLDRLIMLLTKTDNIKDVIAFPKVQNASDLMTEAPSEVEDRQLKDLNILLGERK